jgi:hypothetical protein
METEISNKSLGLNILDFIKILDLPFLVSSSMSLVNTNLLMF